MKSLLVEALRQKDGKQDNDSLSDSGSFATPNADAAAVSPEEAVPTDVAAENEELELMATGTFVVANDENDEPVLEKDEPDVEFTDTLTTTTQFGVSEPVVPTQDSLPSMPPLARHAPLACIVLGVVAALAWFGIQQLELQQDRSTLGNNAQMLRADRYAQEMAGDVTQPRFRYLGVDGTPIEDEAQP